MFVNSNYVKCNHYGKCNLWQLLLMASVIYGKCIMTIVNLAKLFMANETKFLFRF